MIKENLTLFGPRRFLTEKDVYQFFINYLVEATESQIGYLHRYSEKTQQIELNVWSDEVYKHCNTIHEGHYFLENAGVWADCIRSRKTVVHNDYDKLYGSDNLPEGHYPIFRHMSTCIMENNEICGLVGVGNALNPYGKKEVKQFEEMVRALWPQVKEKIRETNEGIDLNLRYEGSNSREEILLHILSAVSRAIETRDELTSFHQANTAHIACLIGKEMNLPEEQLFGLRLGALLHDIGKLTVPTQLLTKTGQLSQVEYELLKTHAENGSKFFSNLRIPWPVDEIILQHHERIDGSGYPMGLIGDLIRIEARIIAVADSFDTMSSDRLYRQSLGRDKAILELKKYSGIKYDSDVVNVFVDLFAKDPSFGGRYKKR
ncbi:HD domain-containing phosphohydrolase [Legionella londiniensis]|uniref:Metal dependent phosphohydrolase n=1 Tax=Legionella londiniensis TaxID=45068 RepID=A0A0W0VSN0_9GAMM|nr:HD domain-containing phosphohydrolase [Legionella londiniensis]KTD22630.1 metal dependent phosphohydrolase [Legionella londiniensis]STX92560.1 metal dependent phosphohydrolase [Legionella londiniensis]